MRPKTRSQGTVPQPLRVDAHHHLWRYTGDEFTWIDDTMCELRRDFLVDDLERTLSDANVAGAVAVQARQTVAETEWLLELAERTSVMLGVVGWLPLTSDDMASCLDRFASRTLLKGVRHAVQGEAPGFLDGPAFNRGLSMLRSTGLTYDILVYERQLEEVIRLVDRHPGQSFVLDHIAKPRIAAGEMEPWRTRMRDLAFRPNVTCKISGMVTEADPKHWTADQLRPYFDAVLEAFGPCRLMVGSDWPVLTVGCSYGQWWRLLELWIETLSQGDQAEVLCHTAMRVYGLELPPGRTVLDEGEL